MTPPNMNAGACCPWPTLSQKTRHACPDGSAGDGLAGLRLYLHDKRQDDFIDNLCRKLLSYGLGRSLLLSDKKTLEAMRTSLATDGYAMNSLLETIVTSPQFLNK